MAEKQEKPKITYVESHETSDLKNMMKSVWDDMKESLTANRKEMKELLAAELKEIKNFRLVMPEEFRAIERVFENSEMKLVKTESGVDKLETKLEEELKIIKTVNQDLIESNKENFDKKIIKAKKVLITANKRKFAENNKSVLVNVKIDKYEIKDDILIMKDLNLRGILGIELINKFGMNINSVDKLIRTD